MSVIHLSVARPVAVARLSDFVNRTAQAWAGEHGFAWLPTPDAPDTYERLQAAHGISRASGRPLPVSSLHCDNVIFTSRQTNHAMRFWHDMTHLTLDRSFSVDDEYVVAAAQLDELVRDGFEPGSLEYRLLHADTMGETYCLASLGRFPLDQQRFVWWCITDGLDEAVAYESVMML